MKPDTYWSAVEPYWDFVSIVLDPAEYVRRLRSIPQVSGYLLTTHWVQSEVCNGGFEQLFYNSTGVLAPEAMEGFSQLGMPKTAEIVSQAMALLGEAYPREREARQEAVSLVHENDAAAFEALDEEFFRLIDAEGGGYELLANTLAGRARYAEE